MQLPFDLNPDPAVGSYVVRNADEAVTYGAELGARWRALPELELFGSVGLLQTEITSYPGPGVEGNDLTRSPAFTAAIGAPYLPDSGFDSSADARCSATYQSAAVTNHRGHPAPTMSPNRTRDHPHSH